MMDSYWSREDNHRLKKAMIRYPSDRYEKQERWRRISRYMGDRTKRECYNQYKILKRKYREQRQEIKSKRIPGSELDQQPGKVDSDHLVGQESNEYGGWSNEDQHEKATGEVDRNQNARRSESRSRHSKIKNENSDHCAVESDFMIHQCETTQQGDDNGGLRRSKDKNEIVNSGAIGTVRGKAESKVAAPFGESWNNFTDSPKDDFSDQRPNARLTVNTAEQKNKDFQFHQDTSDGEDFNKQLLGRRSRMSPTELKMNDCEFEDEDFGVDEYQPSLKTQGGVQQTQQMQQDVEQIHTLSNDVERVGLGSVSKYGNESKESSYPSQLPNASMGKGYKISINAAKAVRQLLFGNRKPNVLNDAWRKQGFFFSTIPDLGFGLIQLKGGPCGVIAAVQAFVIRELLYSETNDVSDMMNKAGCSWKNPTAAVQRFALSRALAAILWRAAIARSAATANRAPVEAIVAVSSANGMGGSRRGVNYRPDGFTEEVVLKSASSFQETQAVVASSLGLWMRETGPGVALLLMSLILTRGVGCPVVEEAAGALAEMKALPSAQDDIDSGLGEAATLIGNHSYAGQELVNLLLTGRAFSNVFDGEKVLGESGPDSIRLRGIPDRGVVGFLTLFEHYGHASSGKNMKIPKNPIWVVCSESHYSVLFAPKVDGVDVHDASQFDLHYYDELGQQDELYTLTVNCEPGDDFQVPDDDDPYALIPPLESCIRTKWSGAEVDWNGSDPLL